MIPLIHSLDNSMLPIRGPFQVHVVHKNKPVSRSGNVFRKHGDNFFVDCFMLSIADGVFSIVDTFTVVVETECARGDVGSRRDLGKETVAEIGFAGATCADEEDDEFVFRVGEEGGDCIGIRRELFVRDLGVLTTNKNQFVCEGIENTRGVQTKQKGTLFRP